MAWGYSASIDCKGCDKRLITDKIHLESWVKDLVKRIDMLPFGEPKIVHFGEGDLAGFTVIQLIMTSSIVAHFNDCDGSAYIDVFSCKDYDVKIVEDCIGEYFYPSSMKTNFLERQA